MPEKPTYEELKKRIRDLEQAATRMDDNGRQDRFVTNADTSVHWKTDAEGRFIAHQPSRVKQTVHIGAVNLKGMTDRVNAENKIRDELQTRSTLLDNIPDCIALILKKKTREIVASNKFAHEIGAIPGKTCHQTCSMLDNKCPWCLAPLLWQTDQPQKTEIYHEGRYYKGVWKPLNKDYYVHYIFDITEQKQIEKEIEKNRTILSNAEILGGFGGWEWDLVEKEWHLSNNWLRLHGGTDARLKTKDFMSFVHPADVEKVQTALDRAIQHKELYTQEYRIIRQDTSQIRFIQAHGEVKFDKTGTAVKFFGATQDITDRVRQEATRKKQVQLETHASELEKMNTVLNVLIDHRNDRMKKRENEIVEGFEKQVFPYLNIPMETKSHSEITSIIGVIKNNIQKILFQNSGTVEIAYRGFTPLEIQVADLIKANKMTKEIAQLLNLSVRAVYFHRENIRKKLKLSHKKVNLRVFLQSSQ